MNVIIGEDRMNVITVPHPVTGTPCRMFVSERSKHGIHSRNARKAQQRLLRMTLRVTPREQWTIDRNATLQERGAAKILGLVASHIYAQPATGRAQPV